MPNAINKIPKKLKEAYRIKDDTPFEIIIKMDDEVIYHNKGYSGCACIVQSIDEISDNGDIGGDSQTLVFGPAPFAWFGVDQLNQKAGSVLRASLQFFQNMGNKQVKEAINKFNRQAKLGSQPSPKTDQQVW